MGRAGMVIGRDGQKKRTLVFSENVPYFEEIEAVEHGTKMEAISMT